MSADKRSVSTDALETLGTIIDEKAGRDAIHIAVEPVVASQRLYPGQDIGLREDGQAIALPEGHPKALGIVDPFLKSTVQMGERFWMLIYPRQITSLRHVWSHPELPEPVDIAARGRSETWLRKFLADGSPSFEEVLSLARSGQDVTHFGHDIEYKEVPSEFYDHLEVLTGRKFTERPDWFSCAC